MDYHNAAVYLMHDIPPEPSVNDYYPGYSYALTEHFPLRQHTSGPTVGPELEERVSDDPTNSFGSFNVHESGGPDLLALEIRVPAKLASSAARKDADAHIRQRMAQSTPKCPLERFHAVSAFGTRLCFYTSTMRDGEVHIEPPLCPDPSDPAPISRWDCAVLEPDGDARLKAIADEINASYPPDEPPQ